MWFEWSVEFPEWTAPTPVEASDLMDRVRRALSWGEVEFVVGIEGSDFPYVTVASRADVVVVHGFAGEGSVAVLDGDSSVTGSVDVQVHLAGAAAVFTGDVAMTCATAENALAGFSRSGALAAMGDWTTL